MDQVDQGGLTPLFMASMRGFVEIVRALLEAGANKDKVIVMTGGVPSTAHLIANLHGHQAIVNLLEEKGAAFSGMGQSLGGDAGAEAELTPEQARARRLARFGGGAAAPLTAREAEEGKSAAQEGTGDGEVDSEDEAELALALKLSMEGDGTD